MTETLETALHCGLSFRPHRPNEPQWKLNPVEMSLHDLSFDRIVEGWFPLTYVLNNLNRSMGQPDAYPFVLSTPALKKLRFVHEVVRASSTSVKT